MNATKPRSLETRHVYRLVVLASVDTENSQTIDNITSFAINQLKTAKGYTLIKRSVESNDLFIQPNKPE